MCYMHYAHAMLAMYSSALNSNTVIKIAFNNSCIVCPPNYRPQIIHNSRVNKCIHLFTERYDYVQIYHVLNKNMRTY